MSDPFDATTIIFALLAVFVFYKLRTVLGTRTGNEQPPQSPLLRTSSDNQSKSNEIERSNVVPLPGASPLENPNVLSTEIDPRWRAYAEPKTWEQLNNISKADPTFAPKTFLDGAKAAYELIVTAFAKGDKPALLRLLTTEVYEGFAAAIAMRENRGEKVEMTFVSVDNAKIDDVHFRESTVQMTVRFLTKLITVTKNSDNEVVDGNPDKVVDITDVWTFSRDIKSKDPNWKLVATETGH